MANRASMIALYARLGFTAPACAVIYDDQGLDALDELALLTDLECESLCKLIRRPGGHIPNPRAGDPGEQATIPGIGNTVSMRSVTNLKLAGFWVRHRIRTSRAYHPVDCTLTAIRGLRVQKEEELVHVVPDYIPKIHKFP